MEKKLVEMIYEKDFVNARTILEKKAADAIVRIVDKKKNEYTKTVKKQYAKG